MVLNGSESLASLLCSKIVQPLPVHLPLYLRVAFFFSLDQEIISSVMGIFLFAWESLTNISIKHLFRRAQGVLLMVSCH